MFARQIEDPDSIQGSFLLIIVFSSVFEYFLSCFDSIHDRHLNVHNDEFISSVGAITLLINGLFEHIICYFSVLSFLRLNVEP